MRRVRLLTLSGRVRTSGTESSRNVAVVTRRLSQAVAARGESEKGFRIFRGSIRNIRRGARSSWRFVSFGFSGAPPNAARLPSGSLRFLLPSRDSYHDSPLLQVHVPQGQASEHLSLATWGRGTG